LTYNKIAAGKLFAEVILYSLQDLGTPVRDHRSWGKERRSLRTPPPMHGNSWKKENTTMHKLIITLGFFIAVLSSVILHAMVPKENSLKTYSTVAAQFAYHVPHTEHPFTPNYLF